MMLKNNHLIVALVSSILSVIGAILIINTTFGRAFFTLNLFQVLQLLITLLVGVYLSAIVNHRRSKESKRIEFSLRIIDDTTAMIQEDKDTLFALLQDGLDDDAKKKILLIIKRIHNKLVVLEKIRCIDNETSRLKTSARECSDSIKDTLTEEWGQAKLVTVSDIETVRRSIEAIVTRLDEIQLHLLNR